MSTTHAEALQRFYVTLQAMQGALDLAQHASDHDDEMAHFMALLTTFYTPLQHVFCVLADTDGDNDDDEEESV